MYELDREEHNQAFKILIDGLWPRGVKKEAIDLWFKSIAPSAELRKWYDHDIDKWQQFRNKYRAELDLNSEVVIDLMQHIRDHERVLLLYSTKAQPHNNATVLLEYLKEKGIK